MQAIQHNSAPWKLQQESIDPEWHIITDDVGLIVANVHIETERDRSTANLLTATPELLDAAQLLVAAFDAGEESEQVDWEDIDEAVRVARRALEKAAGGNPDGE